jgi:hypothetical protein
MCLMVESSDTMTRACESGKVGPHAYLCVVDSLPETLAGEWTVGKHLAPILGRSMFSGRANTRIDAAPVVPRAELDRLSPTGIRLFERMLAESSAGFPDQANKFPDGPT